jgi:CheY-like chemotaxis protein
MELHGGFIRVTSAGVEKGCTFYLCIPVYCGGGDDDDVVVHVAKRSSSSSVFSKMFHMSKVQPINECNDSSFAVDIDATTNHPDEVDDIESHPQPVQRKETNDLSYENTCHIDHFIDCNDIITPSSSSSSSPHIVAATVAAAAAASASTTRVFHPLKILVVDDSSMNRKVNIKMIQAETERLKGAAVLDADDGDVAVDLVKKSIREDAAPFDVVLMDSVMGRMHGPKAVRAMRGKDVDFKGDDDDVDVDFMKMLVLV